MQASLYVHIPFCARKCAYCDFESYAGRLNYADSYIDALLEEARQYAPLSISTAYIGGGTPSLLSPEQLKRLLGGLTDIFEFAATAEFSMEANPGTVTPEKLRAARSEGINRISFGVQAYQPRLLKLLGRIHRFDEAATSVKLAQDAGISNINCDLMYALPGQTVEDLSESIAKVAELKPTHISCYSLILEEGTPLYNAVACGALAEPDEDTACLMQAAAISETARRGYERYEISNYALPGYECRHNIVYWTGANYLGLGCAAHSFMDNVRFANPDYDRYMQGERRIDITPISDAERLEELILLGTRMTRGISTAQLPQAVITAAASPRYKGLIELDGNRLRFTDAGMQVHNRLVLELVDKL